MAVRLPDEIEIGPFTYTVSDDEDDIDERSEDEGAALFAYIDHNTLEILLEPSQADDQKRDSLLHECLHAIVVIADLELEPEAEESIVRRVSPLLLDIVRRNPDLVAFLTADP